MFICVDSDAGFLTNSPEDHDSIVIGLDSLGF